MGRGGKIVNIFFFNVFYDAIFPGCVPALKWPRSHSKTYWKVLQRFDAQETR